MTDVNVTEQDVVRFIFLFVIMVYDVIEPRWEWGNIPLRHIVSSRGYTTYEVGNELARFLRPLVGNSPHHIKNTRDFVQQVQGLQLQPNECITSYDVSVLFTSVPIDPAITIIRRILELDQEFHLRTSMSVEQIISLLEFCLKTTYFQFQGKFFQQVQGAAMGSPMIPIVANLYMKDFEIKAISTEEHPQRIWKRYVDNTFVVIQSCKKETFLEHINEMGHTSILQQKMQKQIGPSPSWIP